MAFSDQILTDMAVFFNLGEMGKSATYNSAEITAIIDKSPGGDSAKQAVLYVKESDVAAPAYQDTVVIDSVTWKVQGDANTSKCTLNDGVWTIEVQASERFNGWT